MKQKALAKTNSYLRNRRRYRLSLLRNIASSTAVEIGRIPRALKQALAAQARRLKPAA